MESKLLNAAKSYQRKCQWEKAIACYEQYMNENSNNIPDTVFAPYARCLRITGRTSFAKKILMKGNELFPQNEQIIAELFTLYDVLGDWNAAKNTADALIDMNPEKADYHFKLGRAYTGLAELRQAEQAYENGLAYTHGMLFEKLAERIQMGFTNQPADFTAEYKFIKGKNNYGAIIHQNGNKKYFTKITKYNRNAKREETFYKDICTQYPALQQIAPAYIDSQVIDRILYLTIEMVDGIPQGGPLRDVIAVSKQISEVPYQDFIETYQNPNYLFQLKSRAVSIVPFFTQIHKKYYNERLFASLYLLAQQKPDPDTAEQIVQRLQTMIMDNHLYVFIKPENHYSLLHGDFIPQNIKANAQNDALNVFDWATFTTGPHFLDIVRFVSASSIPYEDVKDHYVFNDATNNLSLIEKIFFLYAFILMHFVPSRQNQIDKKVTEWILSALEDMEACVAQFKREEFEFVIQTLLDDRAAANRRIKKINKRHTHLKKEHQQLQDELHHILTSKSWRLTAPLRKLMEWINTGKRKQKK